MVNGSVFFSSVLMAHSIPWWSEMMLSYSLTLTLFIFVIQQSMVVLVAWVIRVGAVCIILRLCYCSVLFNLAFPRESLLESMLMSPMIRIFWSFVDSVLRNLSRCTKKSFTVPDVGLYRLTVVKLFLPNLNSMAASSHISSVLDCSVSVQINIAHINMCRTKKIKD